LRGFTGSAPLARQYARLPPPACSRALDGQTEYHVLNSIGRRGHCPVYHHYAEVSQSRQLGLSSDVSLAA